MLFGATAVSCSGADCLRSWPQSFDDLGGQASHVRGDRGEEVVAPIEYLESDCHG